jgi:AtzE family amidohydrolase
MKLLEADALAIAAAIRARDVSASEVTRAFLSNIAANNAALNCFTALTERRALTEARAVDAAIAAGQATGPLAGVPYAVKNLFDIEGMATLAGSRINAELAPAQQDATAVRQLQSAGAILLGALNMDEYAYGFTTENTHYGPVRNPHDRTRTAGGSSGGSAAAVAGGLVPLSLGSDTNGSVRVPAALCGTFGIKPTFGRLGRAGCFPMSNSLDTVGAFARTAADLAACYDALLGADPCAPAAGSRPSEPVSRAMLVDVGDLRIAVADDYFERYSEDEAQFAVAEFARALGATRRVTIPEAERARAAAYIITATEVGNLHLPNLRTRPQDFEPRSKDRMIAGAIAPAAWYLQAQRFRHWFRANVARIFETVDLILAPASPCSATPIGATSMTLRGADVAPRAYMGMLTQPISFIGLPTITVPFIRDGQMPLGVQVIAAPWREDLCFRVAHALEEIGVARSVIAHP